MWLHRTTAMIRRELSCVESCLLTRAFHLVARVPGEVMELMAASSSDSDIVVKRGLDSVSLLKMITIKTHSLMGDHLTASVLQSHSRLSLLFSH